MQKCDKCSGTGLYRSFGVCFLCKGSGRIKSGRGLSVEMAPARQAKAYDCNSGVHSWIVTPNGKSCEQCGEKVAVWE